MDQLLKTLTDIFRITEPEDRIPHFCDHFLPQAKPVLYGSLNVHLDYCGLQEDDPSGQISALIPLALNACLIEARNDQIQCLAKLRDSNPKLGLGILVFKALASAVAQTAVRSHMNEPAASASSTSYGLNARAVDAEPKANTELQRQFSVLELEEGPEFEDDPPPFAVAIAAWEPSAMTDGSDPTPSDRGNCTQTPQYHVNWKRFRMKLFAELTSGKTEFTPSDGAITDSIDKALRKALAVDRKKTPTIPYPYGYVKSAIRKLIIDEQKKQNKHDAANALEPLENKSPAPDQSIIEAETAGLIRQLIGGYEEHSEEVLVAKWWDDFQPQVVAQKLYYLRNMIRSAKSIGEDIAKARKRLQDDLERYGF